MKPGLAGLQMLKTSKQGGLHTSINIKTQKECAVCTIPLPMAFQEQTHYRLP
jgi:hypothetical protein